MTYFSKFKYPSEAQDKRIFLYKYTPVSPPSFFDQIKKHNPNNSKQMFICGTGSFSNQDHEVEHEAHNSPCSTPKRSKKNTNFCKIICRENANKNPYADRGLDKFYALLADLDDKKQKIYTQKGSEDISFVRFVYTNESDDVKPIVVKVKDKKTEETKNLVEQRSFKSTQSDAPEKIAAASPSPDDQKAKKRRCLIRSCNASFNLTSLKQPRFYFPVMVVMILVFLAIYGRSFAILCTSIGWYLAPTIVGGSSASSSAGSGERKPKRKKEYVRRQSERSLAGPSSPKSVINGLQHQEHDRKKSW